MASRLQMQLALLIDMSCQTCVGASMHTSTCWADESANKEARSIRWWGLKHESCVLLYSAQVWLWPAAVQSKIGADCSASLPVQFCRCWQWKAGQSQRPGEGWACCPAPSRR